MQKTEKKKTKILYIITKSEPFGGAQKCVFDLATSLSKDEYEIAVLLGGKGELKERLQSANITVFSTEVLKRNINIIEEIKSFFFILKTLKKYKPDVLHLHSPKAGGLGALAGRLYNLMNRLTTYHLPLTTSIIYTNHGWAFNESRPTIEKILIKLASWVTGLLMTKIIVLSPSEFNAVEKWPLLKKKLVIIPNGIKPINFLAKSEARKKLGSLLNLELLEDDFIVGTIAELHPNKGLKYAVESLRKLHKIKYIVIGEGEEREKLERSIQDSKNIFLAGKIKNASELLKAFDVFLLPSLKEGLPYTLLEAGLASVPIIATRVGGIPDLIIDKKNGTLISPARVDEISSALETIIDNKENGTRMSWDLLEIINKNYTLGAELSQIYTLYKSA